MRSNLSPRYNVYNVITMKAAFLSALLMLGSSPVWAEDWKTTDGVIYEDVKVVKVEDDAITILYKDGGALVPLAKLPPPIQQRYDYDPAKAKAAADARAKQEVADAKALQAEIDLANKLKNQQQVNYANAKGAASSTASTDAAK